jgi:phage I-like protein
MDATAVFETVRQCAASCRATAVYAGDRGMDGKLIGKLTLCADACVLAQRAMDLGYAEICEELCEAAAAACHECAEACGVIADDPQMAACAAICGACEKACASMDTDGDMAMEPGDALAASDQPRLLLLIGSAAEREGLRRVPVTLITRGFKGKQKYAITADDLQHIVANFRKRGNGEVVIDYDHSTLIAGDGQPKPAAGWLKEIDDAPDAQGVLWGWAQFTEKAAAMLAAGEYKYTSPVTDWTKRDKTTGEPQGATLTSLALTNSPLFEKLPSLPLVACESDGWKFDRGDVVEGKKETKAVKILRVVMAAVAAGKVRLVADDNTESEHVLEGLKVLTMTDVKRGKDGRYDFASLPHDEGTLVASDVLHAMDVQTELDAAVKAGKVTPAQRGHFEKLAASDLAGFRDLVKTLPVQVETGERGVAGNGEEKSGLRLVEAEIDTAIAEKRKANPKLTYTDGLKLVASEKPELLKRRSKLMRAQIRTEEEEGEE